MKRRPPGWVVFAAALALALGVAVWTTSDSELHPAPLDPRNPSPIGAQALAKVLADEGVEVDIVRSADALDDARIDESTTVVVTNTGAMSPSTLRRAREDAAPGTLILVGPSYALLQEIDEDIDTLTVTDAQVQADCSSAVDGLTLEVDELVSFTTAGEQGCFDTGPGVALLEVDDADLVLFGAGNALSNGEVTRGDNAAVALRLLGSNDRLVWYVADHADATSDEAVTLGSLIPRWIGPGIWLGALAVMALMFWRFRRLGPLSTEPLPVVVRAVETAHSRGRMYRRSGDRGHVARALRRAARADLAVRLGLDRSTPPGAVIEATALHLDTRVENISALLNDDQFPPATDHDLVGLAQALTRLRREVRRG